MTESVYAIALGLGTKNSKGEWLEVYYPAPLLQPDAGIAKAVTETLDWKGGPTDVVVGADKLTAVAEALRNAGATDQAEIADALASQAERAVICILEQDSAPDSVAAGYLKLHLLSHRLVRPQQTNLNGLFGILPNVAWTNRGAIDLSELPAAQFQARLRGEIIEVMSVDKFPKMTNYVMPSGVRIAHTARVRLGAYLGEGTTVMHEGFVNFNAGTEGPGMIEGRVSAGIFIGSGSDIGGGASTMGTLSGGNEVIISIGKNCLIGANAGCGIPLGDRCTIEAGLYITGGSVVSVLDDKNAVVQTLKARDLAGHSDLLFRRNSQSGAIEALSNKSAIELNEALHAHN